VAFAVVNEVFAMVLIDEIISKEIAIFN